MLSASSSRQYQRPLQLLASTFAISLFSTAIVYIATKLGQAQTTSPFTAFECLLLLITIGNVTSIWYSMMTLTQTPDTSNEVIACIFIGLGGAMLGVIELVASQQTLPTRWLFYLSVVAQVTQLYGASYLMARVFQLAGRWPNYFAFANAGLLLAVSFAAMLGQSWRPLNFSVMHFSLISQSTLLLQPLVLLGVCVAVPSLRLHPTNVVEAIKMRISARGDMRGDFLTFIALGGSALILLIVNATSLTNLDTNARQHLPVAALSLAWVPALWHCFNRIRELHDRYQEHFLMARFSGSGAKRFVNRNYSSDHAWAATVGLRTACFVIDHDPDDTVGQQLPATLYQIRNDEIYRCVVEVLGNGSLHNRVLGNQILGSIDPEDSLRPCMDVLAMFACLYLDAMPLIEKRLKGLTALLPIIDPQLAVSMGNTDITKTWRRNLWLFHFDFDWADQHIVSTPKYTHYEVHMNDVPASVRTAVFNHLQKKNRLGNFIWVGEKARNRIIEEAPILGSIIESWPVPLPQSNDEILVFLIKFEELVPRLQKYFNLDKLRTLLRDFDPSNESSQFLNIIDLQILQARGAHDILTILDTISNYPWRGFREKDQALQTIVKAHNLVKQHVVNESEALQAKVQARFIAAITNIGYPSQILHLAQLRKFHLRDPDKVIETARSTSHPRFHEAWLIMATTNANRYSAAEIRVFLDFLSLVPKDSGLQRSEFVAGKCLASWVNFGRELKESPPALHTAILNSYAEWLVEQRANASICAYFLDCKIFLEQHLGITLEFQPAVAQKLADYFNFLRQIHGPASPEIAAIAARWQMLGAKNHSQAA